MFRGRGSDEPPREDNTSAYWVWRESITSRLLVIEHEVKNTNTQMAEQQHLIHEHIKEIQKSINEQKSQLTRIMAIVAVITGLLYFVGPRLLDVFLKIGQNVKP